MSKDAVYPVVVGGLIAVILAYWTEPASDRPIRALLQVVVSTLFIGSLVIAMIGSGATDAELLVLTGVVILGITYLLLPKTLAAASTAVSGIPVVHVLIPASVVVSAVAFAASYDLAPRTLLVALGASLLVVVAAFGWAGGQERSTVTQELERPFALIGGAMLIMYFESAVVLKWAAEQRDATAQLVLTAVDVLLVILAFWMFLLGLRRLRQFGESVAIVEGDEQPAEKP